MDAIRLESGPARDKHTSDCELLAVLRVEGDVLTIALQGGVAEGDEYRCKVWEHTVYELENLAAGLRFAAQGLLPKSQSVPSEDVLIGPVVNLWPAVAVEVGHPGFNHDSRGAMFYCSFKASPFAKRDLVFVSAVLQSCGKTVVFEVEDALTLADRVYEVAKELAGSFFEETGQPSQPR